MATISGVDADLEQRQRWTTRRLQGRGTPMGHHYGGRAVELPFIGTKAGGQQLNGHNAGADEELG